jgi:hypothetical protein
MVLDNLLANCQANTGPGVGRLVVQALKHAKNAVGILRVDANAIVAHGEDPFLIRACYAYMHSWLLIPMELDGITDEVLHQLDELSRVPYDGRQRIMCDD